MFSSIGTHVLRSLNILGSITIFTFSVINQTFRKPFRFRQLILMMDWLGVKSLPIAGLVGFFSGAVLVLQTGYQLQKFGAAIYASGIASIALTREIGPVLTGVVVAARVGANIAASLSSMRITEQIDALETLATNPISYLVVPRFLATLIMLPILTIFSDVIGMFGGYLVGITKLGFSSSLYIKNTFEFLDLSDVYAGIIKSLVFGAIIALVSCYQGFHASGGAEGVGRATTMAVVASVILIIVSNYFLSNWILLFTGLL